MISDASALNPDFACEPSQFGVFSDAPHLHNAHNLFPSVSTINGPFSFALIVTFTISGCVSTTVYYGSCNIICLAEIISSASSYAITYNRVLPLAKEVTLFRMSELSVVVSDKLGIQLTHPDS